MMAHRVAHHPLQGSHTTLFDLIKQGLQLWIILQNAVRAQSEHDLITVRPCPERGAGTFNSLAIMHCRVSLLDPDLSPRTLRRTLSSAMRAMISGFAMTCCISAICAATSGLASCSSIASMRARTCQGILTIYVQE